MSTKLDRVKRHTVLGLGALAIIVQVTSSYADSTATEVGGGLMTEGIVSSDRTLLEQRLSAEFTGTGSESENASEVGTVVVAEKEARTAAEVEASAGPEIGTEIGNQAGALTEAEAETGSEGEADAVLETEAALALETTADTGSEAAVTAEAEHAAYAPIIEVAAISQMPELFNGCELTSLTMLLNHMGQAYDKMDLIDSLPYDPTRQRKDNDGVIEQWGDPEVGFVGDIRGNGEGYAIYHEPLGRLLDELYEPGSADLTGMGFEEVERQLAAGKPVIAWTTAFFAPTDLWLEWTTPDGKAIEATFMIHTVLIVGSDEKRVYVNDPLTGEQAKGVDKRLFVASWEQLGQQALTFADEPYEANSTIPPL